MAQSKVDVSLAHLQSRYQNLTPNYWHFILLGWCKWDITQSSYISFVPTDWFVSIHISASSIAFVFSAGSWRWFEKWRKPRRGRPWWNITPGGWQCQVEQENYANPVYGVATICHQVRWLRWGHLSLFQTATSLLIWYKMFCMRDISYRLIWMEFINMFSVYAQSETHSRFNWLIIVVFTYNPSVLICVEITDTSKL